MKTFITIGLVCSFVSLVTATCNVCGPTTGIACVNNNQFNVCNDNVQDPTQLFSCPVGLICTTEAICDTASATVEPSCGVCGQCTIDKRFACVDTNKFQFCFASNYSSGTVGTCPAGMMCDYNAVPPYICTTTTTPTCSMAIIKNTIGVLTPSAWCASNGRVGTFIQPIDTSCKTFYKCFQYNSVITGNMYSCPGKKVFNIDEGNCVDSSTYTCPLNVA